MAYNIPTPTGTANQILVTQGTPGQTLSLIAPFIRPSQPCFYANLSGNVTNATGDGTNYPIVCDTEIFDSGGNYNPTTGQFTAPVTGRYLFISCVTLSNLTVAHTGAQNRLVTGTTFRGMFYRPGANFSVATGQICFNFSLINLVAASQVVRPQIVVSNGTKTVTVVAGTNATFFCGYLVC